MIEYRWSSERESWFKLSLLEDKNEIGYISCQVTDKQEIFENFVEGYLSPQDFSKIYKKQEIIKISYITILEQYRNKNFGSLLISKMLEDFQNIGYTQFFLVAAPMNNVFRPPTLSLEHLLLFYRRFGFTPFINNFMYKV